MKPSLRDRLLMPVLLPIAIVLVIAATLFGFSRVLLSLTATAATVTATVAGLGVLAIAGVAASRPQVRLSTLGAMVGATAGVAMLAGGIGLAVVAGTEEGGEEPGPGAVVELAAANLAFEPTSLSVPAGEPFTIRFANQDADVQHNVDVFDNQEFGGTALFEGELVTGVATVEYAVEPLEAGTYFFRCVVHPTMTGEIAVEGGGGGGAEPGAGPAVVAQGLAFDTSTIELPAGQPATITFDNRDGGTQHNIAIYTDDSLGEELFNGELIAGPATTRYEVPPLEAGEYYFLCIVHPDMNGTVVVDGGGGPPEPTGST